MHILHISIIYFARKIREEEEAEEARLRLIEEEKERKRKAKADKLQAQKDAGILYFIN
jgi:hypothetical protein